MIVAPEWIDDIDWAESLVTVDLEQQLLTHSHYGRDGYWPAPSTETAAHASRPAP